MRFGIAEMSGMTLTRRLGGGGSAQELIAAVRGFDRVASIRELAAEGFDLIELGGDLSLFFPDAFSAETVAGLAALRDELGIAYTVHLPLWSVEPSSPLGPVRRGAVEAVVETIRATAPLEPEVYVLHATNALAAEFYRMRMAEAARPIVLGIFADHAVRSLREIVAATDIDPRRLAVETIEFPFDLTLGIVEEAGTSLCFDTGHVLVGFSGPVDLFEALDRSLPHLAEIHLHDGPWQGTDHSIGYGQDHKPLGQGDLDVGRLMARLDEAAFAGPVIFELPVQGTKASLARIGEIRSGPT